jgi:hypothetical protein
VTVFYDEGNYLGEITDQAIGAAGTGNPQLVLQFRVLSYANGDPVAKQYERTMYRTITEKTLSFVQQDLDTLGFTGTSFRQLDPAFEGFHDLTGKQVEFYCTHEENLKGEMREKWSIAHGPRPIKCDPLAESDYRRLDALFGFKPDATTTNKAADDAMDEAPF